MAGSATSAALEIVHLAVMLYVRFPLGLGKDEDSLHQRGVENCHETVRYWWQQFSPMFATEIGRRRASQMQSESPWRGYPDEGWCQKTLP